MQHAKHTLDTILIQQPLAESTVKNCNCLLTGVLTSFKTRLDGLSIFEKPPDKSLALKNSVLRVFASEQDALQI